MLNREQILEIGPALEGATGVEVMKAVVRVIEDSKRDANHRTTDLVPMPNISPAEGRAYFAGGERLLQELLLLLEQFTSGAWREWPEVEEEGKG